MRDQFSIEILEIIDFAIEADPDSSIFVRKWLFPGTKIYNAKPAMGKGYMASNMNAGFIGPAVFYVDDDDIVYIPEHNGGMVSILTLEGERLTQWGDPMYRSCHGIWGDSHRDIYVVQPVQGKRGRQIVKYHRHR